MSVNMTTQSIAVGDNWTKVGNDYVGDNSSGGLSEPLRAITFDGLSDGQSVVDTVNDPGSVAGSRVDFALGNKGFVNGYGIQASTSTTYGGASSSMKVSIASGSDGDPAGGGTGASYGSFGGGLSLTSLGHEVSEGESLWVGLRVFFPTGFDFNTNIDVLKFVRFGVLGHSFVDQHILESGGTQTGWTLSNENDPMVQADTRRVTRDTLTLGSWHWVEVYIKPNSNGLLTERRIWIDDVLQFERVGVTNKWLDSGGVYQTGSIGQADGDSIFPASDDVLSTILFFTYWNGNSPQNQEMFIQEIKYHKDPLTLVSEDNLGNKIIGSA